LNPAATPSLAWLISPVTSEQCFQEYREQQPLVIDRESPDYFSSLLSFSEVDRVITSLDRRYPDICLKNANDPSVSEADHTWPGGALDIAKLYQLFGQG
jgi:hypothetical protein